MIVLVGDRDIVYGENPAKQIWGLLGAIPTGNKAYIRLTRILHARRRSPIRQSP
ncbi:MAG TPA: hypothetical protein VH482_06655 [Thermomicrobiales bacterium]